MNIYQNMTCALFFVLYLFVDHARGTSERLEAGGKDGAVQLAGRHGHVGRAPLRFREDGTFKILQLTDMHLSGPGVNTYGQDERTVSLIKDLINRHRCEALGDKHR